MPEGLIALLPALIGAGTAATTTGLQLSGAFSPAGDAKQLQQQQLTQQEAQQKAQQTQEQSAFKKFAPDAQGQTGGALGDPSLSAMIAELSGSPADTNLAQQTLFGNTPGLSTGSPGG